MKVPDKNLNEMNRIRYNLLSFLSFLLSYIGILGLRLAIAGVAIGIAFLSEKYIGKIGLTLGWIIGFFAGGLFLIGLEGLHTSLEKLDDKAKTYKRYPYTEKYGRNYPHPKPENFGITQNEFKDYNSRFQFEYIKLLFTYGLCISACIYSLQVKHSGSSGVLLIGGAATMAILLDYLFDCWNKRISERHHCHKKINEFQKALKVYYKIRDENSTI